jgi:hypothetical protein
MKYSLALMSLVWGGVSSLGCGPEDSDPPPVTPGGAASPGIEDTTGGPEPANSAGGSAATNPVGGVAPVNLEGQGGAPLVPAAGGAPADSADPAGVNTGGTSGMMNTGGMNAGGMSAGGAGGAPPAELTLPELVGGLDGHLFSVACGDTPNTDDCAGEGWRSSSNPNQLNVCANARLSAVIDFPIAGEPGAAYDVSMHFYGIMEPRNYGNVVMREAQGRPSLQPGGTPTPFASMAPGGGNYLATGDNNYNTYELHVLDNGGQAVAIHFLNADTQTGHYTFGIDYERTITLIGGGVLRLQIADANCRQIKNCGPGGVPCAGKAQTIDISAADPQPLGLQQPGLGKDPEHSGQWFLLDVLSFEAQ